MEEKNKMEKKEFAKATALEAIDALHRSQRSALRFAKLEVK